MNQFLTGTLAGAALTAAAFTLFQTPTQRIPQFENPAVKVWKTMVAPGSTTPLHRHDHPRIIVALTDGTMDLLDQAGHHDPHPWQAGHAYWLPAMPPGTLHQDANPGDKPIEVMVIELEKE